MQGTDAITQAEAAAHVLPRLHQLLEGYKSGPAMMLSSRQHAVQIASQLSLAIFDALAPGHPAMAAVDAMGHMVWGLWHAQPQSALPAETTDGATPQGK